MGALILNQYEFKDADSQVTITDSSLQATPFTEHSHKPLLIKITLAALWCVHSNKKCHILLTNENNDK